MPDSIFDFARKGSGKPKPSPKIVPPSLPAVPVPAPTAPKEPLKTFDEIKASYAKAMKLKDELDNKLVDLFNKTGVDLKTVQRILDNPSSYEGLDAKAFLAQREKFRNDIWRKTGLKDKEQILTAKAVEEEARQKNKGVGSRKKNWTFIR